MFKSTSKFAGMYGTADEMPICQHPPVQTMDDVTAFFLRTYIHIIGNSVGAEYPFAATCNSALRNSAEKCKFSMSCTVSGIILYPGGLKMYFH